MAKVIASSIRKGNVIDMDGVLYIVLTAENVHPGKGNSVTQVEMRRISDGVKVSERWRTVDSVEKAHVDEEEFDFLYEDGEGFHFMNPETYDQVTVSEEVIGEDKGYLKEGIRCWLLIHEGNVLSIELPQKVTVEVLETEPVVKGQTASSSYKPAVCTGGLRVMVPPHIGVGTKIVISTADNTYSERAKD